VFRGPVLCGQVPALYLSSSYAASEPASKTAELDSAGNAYWISQGGNVLRKGPAHWSFDPLVVAAVENTEYLASSILAVKNTRVFWGEVQGEVGDLGKVFWAPVSDGPRTLVAAPGGRKAHPEPASGRGAARGTREAGRLLRGRERPARRRGGHPNHARPLQGPGQGGGGLPDPQARPSVNPPLVCGHRGQHAGARPHRDAGPQDPAASATHLGAAQPHRGGGPGGAGQALRDGVPRNRVGPGREPPPPRTLRQPGTLLAALDLTLPAKAPAVGSVVVTRVAQDQRRKSAAKNGFVTVCTAKDQKFKLEVPMHGSCHGMPGGWTTPAPKGP